MKRFLIIGGVVAALAVGIVAVAGAGAQESTPDAKPADHYLEVLAGNLGVSADELEAALMQSHIDLVNEKVADGTLTEEEAAAIIERIENGEARLFPPFGGQRPHHGKFHRVVVGIVENASEVLGMETDALVEQLKDGNSLADVATAQGVDVEQFKADLLAAIDADLDAKVADGTITQEQADNIYARLSENIDDIVNKTHDGGPGHRFGPGFGGPRFGGPGFPAPFGDGVDAEATATAFLN